MSYLELPCDSFCKEWDLAADDYLVDLPSPAAASDGHVCILSGLEAFLQSLFDGRRIVFRHLGDVEGFERGVALSIVVSGVVRHRLSV